MVELDSIRLGPDKRVRSRDLIRAGTLTRITTKLPKLGTPRTITGIIPM